MVRGFLGVSAQELTPELAKSFDIPLSRGALVADVSPAAKAKAGVQAGDVVLAVGTRAVLNGGALRHAVGMLKPGSETEIKVLREGQEQVLRVTIGDCIIGANRAGVGSAEEPAAAIKRRGDSGSLLLKVRSRDGTRYVVLRPQR